MLTNTVQGYRALQLDREAFALIAQGLDTLQHNTVLTDPVQVAEIKKLAEDRVIALDAILKDV